MLLASARGERVSKMARSLGCATQTVRTAVREFHRRGGAALEEGARRPQTVWPALEERKYEPLRALRHASPRAFSKPTSLWTWEWVAEVLWEQGLIRERLSRETIGKALQPLGVKWRGAKRWITGPDRSMRSKKATRKTDPLGCPRIAVPTRLLCNVRDS
ncbi:MAG: helix-turn-helix domain-containing protein [Gammaproteobacteria bacterium]